MTLNKRLYANNAKTTLASPVTLTDTSIIVADASKFPSPAANGEYFLVTLDSGSAVEVVEVHGVSGNVFINVVRGCEGTVAQNFQTGTRAENRVTKGTLESFARMIDRVADIYSVDQIPTPSDTTANSYLCVSTDDGGTPIVAVKSGTRWRFVNHPTILTYGASASNGTQTSMPLSGANTNVPVTTPGSHIIQFTTGLNAGLCRIIQSTDASGVYWSTNLPNNVSTLDGYEIYQSSTFSMNAFNSRGDDALIFSILFGE